MWKRIMSLAGVWALLTNIIWGQTIHFQEGFTSVAPGTIPAQWYLGDGGVIDQAPPLNYDSTWTVVTDYVSRTLGQGKFLFIYYNSAVGQKDTIVTDTFDASSPTGNLYLSYLTYYNYFSNDTGYVQVFDGTTWQTVKIYTGSDVGGWNASAHLEVIDITSYANANMRVRFVWHEQGDWYWAVDSITVFSGCLPLTSFQVDWLNTLGDVELIYSSLTSYDSLKVEYGPAGFTPGTGTLVTLQGTSPDTITGLNINQSYDFYIWGYCGNSVTFDTLTYSLCAMGTIPYFEDFESTSPWEVPQCWTAFPNTGPDTIGVDTASTCVLGTRSLTIYGGSGTGYWASTNTFNVSGVNSITVSFSYREGSSTCGNDPESSDSLYVEVFLNGMWRRITAFGGQPNITTFTPVQVNVPVGNIGTMKLRFRAKGTGAGFDNWYVDSIDIATGPCLAPLNVSAFFSSGFDTIYVAWSTVGSDTVIIEYGAPGFAIGSGTQVVHDASAGNLVAIPVTPGDYDIYVWGVCGGTGSVDTVSLTLCGAQSLPYVETFDDLNLFTGCWTTNNSNAVFIDTAGTCTLDSGYLHLWGVDNAYAESPYLVVTPGNAYVVSYYYRPGGSGCGDIPESGDYVVVEWYDTAWHEAARYDGGTVSQGWSFDRFLACPATNTIQIRFRIGNGTGGNTDSWHFDSLKVTPASPQPDIKVVSTELLNPVGCGVLSDTLMIAYQNFGGQAADTVVIGYRLGSTFVYDTVAYPTGFGACSGANDIDTVYIPITFTATGIVNVSVFAEDINNEADPNDSMNSSYHIGDTWVYLDINTQSYGSEVFWKLFYMPDSILVTSVSSGTYASSNSYTDSFCLISGATYRYEAWDSWGDGWNGGTYKWYLLKCGDTIVLADNGGQSPSNGSSGRNDLESVEYFEVVRFPSVDIGLTSLISPTRNPNVCVGSILDSVRVVYRNYGSVPMDTVYVGFSLNGTVRDIDTIVYSGGLAPCAVDTQFIDTVTLTGVGTLEAWSYGVIDSASHNDSITFDYHIGDIWVYLDINTQSWGSEIFWKLFYMPDSVLVTSVSSGTYASSNSYTDSFCLISNATYRFEAWDSYGDGWNGGTYKWYLLRCGDTIVLADNGGQSPSNGSSGSNDLESVEYFEVSSTDIILESFVYPYPDTAGCITKPIEIWLVTTNYNDDSVTSNMHISFIPAGTGTQKDTTLANLTLPTCRDTIMATIYDIASGSYVLTMYIDSIEPNNINDTISIDTIRILDSLPTPPLPDSITVCSKEAPVVLDATITGFTPVSYSWNTGDVTATISVNSSGLYEVIITYGPGCELIDTTNVTVNPSPTASITGPDIIDANVPNTYSASPTGTGYAYQWNTGDTTAVITYTAPTPGKDTLWVIVTNEYGCADTAYKVIEIITGVEVALTYGYQLRYHQPEAIAQVITGKDLIEWIEVHDIAGRVIERRIVNGKNVTLSLKALPRGTYFVVVKGQEAGTIIYKLLR
ncbi:MAG: T9SS type A sorting domain-containing protein [Chlorobi bacterium]|nr:T9SS type A sorting domain-containing protein [Chlorobiota bacterium]